MRVKTCVICNLEFIAETALAIHLQTAHGINCRIGDALDPTLNIQNTCPFCSVEFEGGMTLVRHMHDAHNIDTKLGNMLVDLMYSIVDAVQFPELQSWSIDLRPDLPVNPENKEFLDKFDQEMKRIIASLQPD